MVPQGPGIDKVCDFDFVQKLNFHFTERRFGVLILMFLRENKSSLLRFRCIF